MAKCYVRGNRQLADFLCFIQFMNVRWLSSVIRHEQVTRAIIAVITTPEISQDIHMSIEPEQVGLNPPMVSYENITDAICIYDLRRLIGKHSTHGDRRTWGHYSNLKMQNQHRKDQKGSDLRTL